MARIEVGWNDQDMRTFGVPSEDGRCHLVSRSACISDSDPVDVPSSRISRLLHDPNIYNPPANCIKFPPIHAFAT